MVHPLSDQLFRSMDAQVALLWTSESKDGAEGTVKCGVEIEELESAIN
jgi:hypothetical protein